MTVDYKSKTEVLSWPLEQRLSYYDEKSIEENKVLFFYVLDTKSYYKDYTPLVIAVDYADKNAIVYLVKERKIRIDSTHDAGNTLLHRLLLKTEIDIELIEFLLANFAGMNLVDPNEWPGDSVMQLMAYNARLPLSLFSKMVDYILREDKSYDIAALKDLLPWYLCPSLLDKADYLIEKTAINLNRYITDSKQTIVEYIIERDNTQEEANSRLCDEVFTIFDHLFRHYKLAINSKLDKYPEFKYFKALFDDLRWNQGVLLGKTDFNQEPRKRNIFHWQDIGGVRPLDLADKFCRQYPFLAPLFLESGEPFEKFAPYFISKYSQYKVMPSNVLNKFCQLTNSKPRSAQDYLANDAIMQGITESKDKPATKKNQP